MPTAARTRYNAAGWLLDRHVAAGDGDRLAVICGDDQLTYADVQRQVWRAQHALRALDVRTRRAGRDGGQRRARLPGLVPRRAALGRRARPAVDDAHRGRPRRHRRRRRRRRRRRLGRLRRRTCRPSPSPRRSCGPRSCSAIRAPAATSGCRSTPGRRYDDLDEAPVAATGADSPGFWLYSSGTTGLPKGVMHRHANLEATAETYAPSVLGIGADDRTACRWPSCSSPTGSATR